MVKTRSTKTERSERRERRERFIEKNKRSLGKKVAGRGKGNKKGLADLRKLGPGETKQEEDENTDIWEMFRQRNSLFKLNDEVNIIDGHMDIIGNGKVVQIKPDPVINGRFHFFVYIETEMTFTDILGSSKKFKKGTRQEVKPIYLRKRE
jgi:hypothetical protein